MTQKLEEAKRLYETANADQRYVLESLFPELKESEDERIRKWLIDTIKAVPNDSIEWDVIDKSDVLAWLEKQGEQKPDKVEPKFKNGQWLVWQDKCYKVNDNGCWYELVDPVMAPAIIGWMYCNFDDNGDRAGYGKGSPAPLFGYNMIELTFDKGTLMEFSDSEKQILREAIRIIGEKTKQKGE